MALFKVWSKDRQRRCLVIADEDNALLDLVAKASMKLKINGNQVVLEQDGTPVTEDDVLLMVRKETLILLEQNENWIPYDDDEKSTTSTLSVISTSGSLSLSNPSEEINQPVVEPLRIQFASNGNATPNETAVYVNIDPPPILMDNNMEIVWSTFVIPWHKLPSDMLTACENGQRKKEIITQVVHMVVNEIRAIKANPSTKAVRTIAQKVIMKYPKTFQDTDDDGVVLGDGSISLYNKLYERVSYLNRPHKRSSSFERTINKKIKNSTAGCSNWNPPLSNEEGDLRKIKEKLIKLKDIDILNDETKLYLEKTYSLQREFINNLEPNIEDIKKEWPILFNKNVIIWHFEKVCGSKLENFLSNLEQKCDKFFEMDKADKTAEIEDKYLRAIHILCLHFKEDIKQIHQVVKSNSEETQMGLQPCLIKTGTNPGEMYVYLEKEPVTKVETFGEGLQIIFGLYFVFNLEYPKQASCVLELLQRYILKIHPDDGTKSKKLNASKRKVISFLNKINLT